NKKDKKNKDKKDKKDKNQRKEDVMPEELMDFCKPEQVSEIEHLSESGHASESEEISHTISKSMIVKVPIVYDITLGKSIYVKLDIFGISKFEEFKHKIQEKVKEDIRIFYEDSKGDIVHIGDQEGYELFVEEIQFNQCSCVSLLTVDEFESLIKHAKSAGTAAPEGEDATSTTSSTSEEPEGLGFAVDAIKNDSFTSGTSSDATLTWEGLMNSQKKPDPISHNSSATSLASATLYDYIY
ncbi:hypothetical protein EV182_008355, partial [Spiromyces aspiralis]